MGPEPAARGSVRLHFQTSAGRQYPADRGPAGGGFGPAVYVGRGLEADRESARNAGGRQSLGGAFRAAGFGRAAGLEPLVFGPRLLSGACSGVGRRMPLEPASDQRRQTQAALPRQNQRQLLFGKLGGARAGGVRLSEAAAFPHGPQNLPQ